MPNKKKIPLNQEIKVAEFIHHIHQIKMFVCKTAQKTLKPSSFAFQAIPDGRADQLSGPGLQPLPVKQCGKSDKIIEEWLSLVYLVG